MAETDRHLIQDLQTWTKETALPRIGRAARVTVDEITDIPLRFRAAGVAMQEEWHIVQKERAARRFLKEDRRYMRRYDWGLNLRFAATAAVPLLAQVSPTASALLGFAVVAPDAVHRLRASKGESISQGIQSMGEMALPIFLYGVDPSLGAMANDLVITSQAIQAHVETHGGMPERLRLQNPQISPARR